MIGALQIAAAFVLGGACYGLQGLCLLYLAKHDSQRESARLQTLCCAALILVAGILLAALTLFQFPPL